AVAGRPGVVEYYIVSAAQCNVPLYYYNVAYYARRSICVTHRLFTAVYLLAQACPAQCIVRLVESQTALGEHEPAWFITFCIFRATAAVVCRFAAIVTVETLVGQ